MERPLLQNGRSRFAWAAMLLVSLSLLAGGVRSRAADNTPALLSWGRNEAGQLGDGTEMNRESPIAVQGPDGQAALVGVVAVAGGASHNLALTREGTLYAWGSYEFGQLGDGTAFGKGSRNHPVLVKGPKGSASLTEVTAIACGADHSLALRRDGTVWAWGSNEYGQLGDGSQDNRNQPVPVAGPVGQGVLNDVVAIACGHYHSLALRKDGTVWTWGYNVHGQLGDGTQSNRIVPVPVAGPDGQGRFTGVTALAGGGYHSLAVKQDGTVWAWGYNRFGQLGNGMAMLDRSSSRPVAVLGPIGAGPLSGVVAVAAGYSFSFAVTQEGTVWGWGYARRGQLGDGQDRQDGSGLEPRPVAVAGPGDQERLTDVVRVVCGRLHSLAIKRDGTVWGWGSNREGQLGCRGGEYEPRPVAVLGPAGEAQLTRVTALGCGWRHSLAVRGENVARAN